MAKCRFIFKWSDATRFLITFSIFFQIFINSYPISQTYKSRGLATLIWLFFLFLFIPICFFLYVNDSQMIWNGCMMHIFAHPKKISVAKIHWKWLQTYFSEFFCILGVFFFWPRITLSILSMDKYLSFQFKKLFFIVPRKGINNAQLYFLYLQLLVQKQQWDSHVPFGISDINFQRNMEKN